MNIFEHRRVETLLPLLPYNQESNLTGWRGYLTRGTFLFLGFGAYYLLSKKVDFASKGRRYFYAIREYFPRGKTFEEEKNVNPRIDLRSFADFVEKACLVCLGDPGIGVRASCGHFLCAKCSTRYRGGSLSCPMCRSSLKSVTLASESLDIVDGPDNDVDSIVDVRGTREWIETIDLQNHTGAGGDGEIAGESGGENLVYCTWSEGHFFVRNCIVWCLVALILIAAKLEVMPWYRSIGYDASIFEFLMPFAVMPAIYIWCVYRSAAIHAIRYE